MNLLNLLSFVKIMVFLNNIFKIFVIIQIYFMYYYTRKMEINQ